MSRRNLYLAIGFVWSLLLALATGVAVAAAAAGAAWIWLFGDETWPDWGNLAVLGAGIAASLATFVICMTITRIVANRQGSEREEGVKSGDGAAWLLLALALAVVGGYAWVHYAWRDEQRREAAQVLETRHNFDALRANAHRIAAISIDWPGGGRDGAARIALDGRRAGRYRLDWQLRDSLFASPVMSGGEDIELAAGPRTVDIALPAQAVVDGYRSLLARQDANVLVDEPFLFEARLAPVLSDQDKSQLSDRELVKLTQGLPDLSATAKQEFAVRFFLYGDTLSWGG